MASAKPGKHDRPPRPPTAGVPRSSSLKTEKSRKRSGSKSRSSSSSSARPVASSTSASSRKVSGSSSSSSSSSSSRGKKRAADDMEDVTSSNILNGKRTRREPVRVYESLVRDSVKKLYMEDIEEARPILEAMKTEKTRLGRKLKAREITRAEYDARMEELEQQLHAVYEDATNDLDVIQEGIVHRLANVFRKRYNNAITKEQAHACLTRSRRLLTDRKWTPSQIKDVEEQAKSLFEELRQADRLDEDLSSDEESDADDDDDAFCEWEDGERPGDKKVYSVPEQFERRMLRVIDGENSDDQLSYRAPDSEDENDEDDNDDDTITSSEDEELESDGEE